MDLMQYLEKTYNDCSNPCFVIDYETEVLVFVNQALEKKFQVFEAYQGKHPKDVFFGFIEPEDFCPKEDAKDGDYIETRIYSPGLETYLRANTTLIEKCGQKLLLTKYFLTSVDKKRVEAENSFEKAMMSCLDILKQTEQEHAVENFLKLLCNFYSAELAYICEFNVEKNILTQKYFWHNEKGTVDVPMKENDQLSIESFVHWLQNKNNRDIITIDENEGESPDDSKKILEKYKVSNITMNKLWNKDGSLFGIVGMSNRTAPIYDERLLKAVSHFVVEHFNEVSMVRALESLNEMDLLTGFYNRNKYAQRLSQLHKNPPKSLGVLFVNLNGLRKTNEYFGFEVGDVQIKKTSKQLREFFTEDFYRISGDEFVGFMEDWDKDKFEAQVDQLQVELKTSSHEANFSLGHSWDSGNYNVGKLVKIADTVMVINKQSYYYSTLNDGEDVTNTILRDLFRAIAEDEFLVYLQPQINLDTEEVVGAEALIRRFDKKHKKMVFPDNFIPLYEKNSIIRHVDLFMVRKVCQILKDWQNHEQTMPISVNLSRVTLLEHGIVETITEILDEYLVPHHLVVIEITERVGLIENEVTTALVEGFKEKGFRLSLDDFGCAYSNIVTLSQIEVDEVKIDKSLVDNLINNAKNRIIVKNMLLMCSELENTFSLAEGIETEEQADFLRSVHCHFGQGYLYSRPIPNEEFFQKYIKGIAKTT
ncbi:MAG: bifunctional diguanylate cyclase/phosphodiesterase [Eubacteriales bacterium]